MNRDEWLNEFCRQLGAEAPTPEQVEELLDIAAIAAHASERTAAPLACWIGGRSGRSLAELREIAERVGSTE